MLNGVPLTNTPKVESGSCMLGALLIQFGDIVNHESVNIIPEPVRPSLIQDRPVLAQDSQFISQLLVRTLSLSLAQSLSLSLAQSLSLSLAQSLSLSSNLTRQANTGRFIPRPILTQYNLGPKL
jgi:hypothetical protein